MKNPPVHMRQTNIAHNQQVNNRPPEDQENENPPNELLEETEYEPDKWLDRGTPQSAIRTDHELETVGKIDGTNHD